MGFRGRGYSWSTKLGFTGFLLGLAALLVVTSCGAGPVEEGEEVYLRDTQGPYRGRIVDAQTKDPIPQAVVVAVWYYDVPALVQTNTAFHDAVEVLTDSQGYFVVDAPEIERRAPRHTRFPIFTIFKPGHLFFRGWFASPEEMAERRNRSLLGVMGLTKNVGVGRKERLRNTPSYPFDVPEEKIPNLIKALEEESTALQGEHLP